MEHTKLDRPDEGEEAVCSHAHITLCYRSLQFSLIFFLHSPLWPCKQSIAMCKK